MKDFVGPRHCAYSHNRITGNRKVSGRPHSTSPGCAIESSLWNWHTLETKVYSKGSSAAALLYCRNTRMQ